MHGARRRARRSVVRVAIGAVTVVAIYASVPVAVTTPNVPSVSARLQAQAPSAQANTPPQSTSTASTTTLDGSLVPARSPRNASYTIDARLDPRRNIIAATETVVWRNITSKPASELQFHLYWNAWRSEKSTFMREAAAAGSGGLRDDERATIDVTAIKLTSGTPLDLTNAKRFIAPDDGNADDQTVLQVPLPNPVPPGATISVELTWTATIPRNAPRTGRLDDFYFIAQWFPKLGVLEDTGWNCHQFHYTTEFFSDFGVYDVSLTVPADWTVGATGVARQRRDNGDGSATHRYYQEDVHDFAWTASADFSEHVAEFVHPALPPVRLRLLLMPDHAGQEERHFSAARAALASFGEWFGAYPYGHLTIVDSPYGSDAEGMEYPTLITAGTRWLVSPNVTYYTPEEVTIHEAGHQFWYGVVATNEAEHAWMDEGITTFAAARTMAEAFPESYLEYRYFGGLVPVVLEDVLLSRETYWNRLAGYRPAAESDEPSRPAYKFDPGLGRYISYNKTALWLNTLERLIGWPALQRGLQAFYARSQFSHPAPDDFFAAVGEAAGQDLGWFFDQVYRSSNTFDYGVQALESTGSGDRFETRVQVRRHGEATFPVDVAVTFADGHVITERWDGRDRWKAYTYLRNAKAVSAQVDPRRVLLLDVNYTNNSRSLQPAADAAATKWSVKWMVWLQDVLLTWAFFA